MVLTLNVLFPQPASPVSIFILLRSGIQLWFETRLEKGKLGNWTLIWPWRYCSSSSYKFLSALQKSGMVTLSQEPWRLLIVVPTLWAPERECTKRPAPPPPGRLCSCSEKSQGVCCQDVGARADVRSGSGQATWRQMSTMCFPITGVGSLWLHGKPCWDLKILCWLFWES